MNKLKMRTILFSMTYVLRVTAKRDPAFAAFMRRKNCVAQLRLKDGTIGRHYIFLGGRLTSRPGLHPRPDVTLTFRDLPTAMIFLVPPISQADVVNAAKTFKVATDGRDDLVVWFLQLLNKIPGAGFEYGRMNADGTRRYCTNTNGGPLFVDVKDGKIVRVVPIDLDSSDAPSWVIEARGRRFSPRRQATVSSHALTLKSMVYSDKRLQYPMRRVDFDVNGERNVHNRGISGYVRISWEEALDIVAGEIKRMKREYGPGAMAIYQSSHHQWGNVG